MGTNVGGSVGEFLQFQRIAYTVAKAANPNAVIHLAGFTYWWTPTITACLSSKRFLDALRNDPNAARTTITLTLHRSTNISGRMWYMTSRSGITP